MPCSARFEVMEGSRPSVMCHPVHGASKYHRKQTQSRKRDYYYERLHGGLSPNSNCHECRAFQANVDLFFLGALPKNYLTTKQHKELHSVLHSSLHAIFGIELGLTRLRILIEKKTAKHKYLDGIFCFELKIARLYIHTVVASNFSLRVPPICTYAELD